MSNESGGSAHSSPAAHRAPPRLEFGCPPVVVLDACTIFNKFRTELLLHLARRGLLCVHWTEHILDEYARNLVSRSAARHAKDSARPLVTRAKADAVIQLMNVQQPMALLAAASQSEEALFDRVSRKDRHVAAAARSARLALGFRGTPESANAMERAGRTPVSPPAVGVVTENVRDFPGDAMAAEGLFASNTDTFLLALLDWAGREMVAVLAAHAVGLTRPPVDADTYLETLRRADLKRTASAIEASLRLMMPAARKAATVCLQTGHAYAGRALTAQEEEKLLRAAFDAAYEAAVESATLSGIE